MAITPHRNGSVGANPRAHVAIAVLLLALSSHCAPPAYAQAGLNEDSRIKTLQVRAGLPASLTVVAGVDQTVILPQGEHIQQVIVGDTGAFHVSVPTGQDAVVISAMKPASGTALQVQTIGQRYEFNVEVVLQGKAPLVVRLVGTEQFPPPQPQRAPSPLADGGGTEYRITGDKAVRPSAISDDGNKTTIQWSAAQAIPAVFALDANDSEQMVNGFMRGDSFVIDRVFDRLVFRIDNSIAQARRIPIKKKRP